MLKSEQKVSVWETKSVGNYCRSFPPSLFFFWMLRNRIWWRREAFCWGITPWRTSLFDPGKRLDPVVGKPGSLRESCASVLESGCLFQMWIVFLWIRAWHQPAVGTGVRCHKVIASSRPCQQYETWVGVASQPQCRAKKYELFASWKFCVSSSSGRQKILEEVMNASSVCSKIQLKHNIDRFDISAYWSWALQQTCLITSIDSDLNKATELGNLNLWTVSIELPFRASILNIPQAKYSYVWHSILEQE